MENNQKYTENARALIDRLRIQCTNHNNPSIMPAHLLLELSAPGTRSAELMERLTGADKLADLRSALDLALYEPSATDDKGADYYNRIVTLIIKLAIIEARYLKSPLVDVEHLLLSLFHNKDVRGMSVIVPFFNAGIDYDSLRRQALADANPAEALDIAGNIEPESSAGNSDATDSEEEPDDRSKAETGANSGKYHRTSGRGDTPMLDKFGNDMTRAAEEGRLDPVVGREVEIERLAQILSRRKKKQPGAYRRTRSRKKCHC